MCVCVCACMCVCVSVRVRAHERTCFDHSPLLSHPYQWHAGSLGRSLQSPLAALLLSTEQTEPASFPRPPPPAPLHACRQHTIVTHHRECLASLPSPRSTACRQHKIITQHRECLRDTIEFQLQARPSPPQPPLRAGKHTLVTQQ